MTQLGVGIIGCGNISTAYCRLAPMFKSLSVKAVADINMDAARAKAAEFDLRAETVADLLKAPDIDVVVNLTIPAVHFDVTRQILEAGKHAYSEKPLVLTLEEAEKLRELAAAKNLRVGSAPDTFLGGAHQQARAAIDAGDVGRIIGGTCHVMGHGMESWHPNPDFFFQPGAGPVLDIGPYYVVNLLQLIGPVKSVASLATTTFAERTIGSGPRTGEQIPVSTPTNIHALLEFANGATVTLGASWDVWANRHSPMELYGEDASLFVPDPNFFGGTVEIGGPDKEIRALPTWDHPFGVPNQDDGTRANYRCAGLADMATAIAEGRAHRCSVDLAVHAVDVMTSILRAGEERRFIDLTTTCARPAALSPQEARALLA
ncbi:Gfo/Idh/MocA family protein [Yoonia sediminilitoris]|uniref:Putative dehydrogenase n=1 Tax=Yoonia sediminilitoris TaxID=1286148 RepID=A0A2T6KPH2_9RHOB|nr:Gfo/Idh/MocA family oxidoreductase [Yoonia sediminilitoris]PUB18459.1 putative dehydrogenase [Yoonia sediminilitoris]RCW98627.1 putative dehydrogenase [Yoonia sediminilitoris]